MKKTFRMAGLVLMAVAVSFGLAACGDDDDDDAGITISPASVTLHYDDTYQLKADGATSWLSDDDFVATVDENGLLTGGHVGTTTVVASNGKKSARCEVTITPEYSLYDDPILRWGASLSSIRSAESHEETSSSSSDMLMYNYTFGSNPCVMGYNFENGKLKSILAMFDYSLYARAGYYLLERFQPVYASDDYDFGFIDAMDTDKAKTAVILTTYKSGRTTYATVMYADYSSYSSSRAAGAPKADILKLQEAAAELLKK